MPDAKADSPIRRRRLWATGIALAGLAILVLLWVQRAPIAHRVIAGELARRQVPATYRVSALSPGRAELSDVRIGDAARPDLTARRLAVALRWGLSGPVVTGIDAEALRVRGRVDEDGTLHLGALDRLRPAPSGQPFALPDLGLTLTDARADIATPAGVLRLTGAGSGNLAQGFTGEVTLSATRPALAGCTATGLAARGAVKTGGAAIGWTGPISLITLACGTATAATITAEADLALPERLDSIDGTLRLAAADAHGFDASARRLSFDGRVGGQFAGPAYSATGTVSVAGLAASSDLRARIARAGEGFDSLPIGALLTLASRSAARAAEAIDLTAPVNARLTGKSGRVTLGAIEMTSASGARMRLDQGKGVTVDFPSGRWSADGNVVLAGGGLPSLQASLLGDLGDEGWSANVRLAPYAAGDARLRAGPLFIGSTGHGIVVHGDVAMDGPLAGGRVTGLSFPLAVERRRDGDLLIAPDRRCLDIAFDQLTVAGVRLDAARLPLCRSGNALLALSANGGLSGGFRIDAPTLAGAMAGNPLALKAAALDLGIKGSTTVPNVALTLTDLDLKMGSGGEVSEAAAPRLTLALAGNRVGGRIEGLAGQLANVPLLVDQGDADLALERGAIVATGTARVRDAAADPRFNPVRAEGIRLRFADGQLTGTARLANIARDVAVGTLALTHDFGRGAGQADLAASDLTFGSALQPDDLTSLSRGVVANVVGTVTGAGQIRWSDAGVTSDGAFSTEALALAAAFGPVNGLSGTIRFSDLLGMETPPGQIVSLAEVNPGVAVKDGTVRYQLLPGLKVGIEGGQWPFAGGTLSLDAAILDFSQPVDRALTFRVVGIDAARFIQELEFENIAATGLFDGVLPMIFNVEGGRIEGGRIVARQPGGTLAYVGELSQADIGSAGKIAFDALKSMRYRSLAIDLDGALDGEIVSRVSFDGINESPVDLTGSPLAPKLTGLPFRFNVRVQAPFRGLMNTARSFSDASATIRQAVPPDPDIIPGAAPIHPADSEDER